MNFWLASFFIIISNKKAINKNLSVVMLLRYIEQKTRVIKMK